LLVLCTGETDISRDFVSVYLCGNVDWYYNAEIGTSKLHLSIYLAVELGIVEFLQRYGIMGGGSLSEFPTQFPLLCRAIKRPLVEYWPAKHLLDMIRYLTSCGCSPNQGFTDSQGKETTCWKWLLSRFFYTRNADEERLQHLDQQCIIPFMDAGADLEAGVRTLNSLKIKMRVGIIHENYPGICDKLLLQIASRKASTLAEPSKTSKHDESVPVPFSTGVHGPPMNLQTARKRARSLSPSRPERRKIRKFY
jgi:hypothetical protein